jgi:hypothetical protein
MMKTVSLYAAAALVAAGTALAQAPAPAAAPPAPTVTIAGHKCEKPEFPGKVAPDTRIRKWSADFRLYVDCLKAYIAERNATIEANSKAAKTAVEEFNTNVAEFNETIKSLNQ